MTFAGEVEAVPEFADFGIRAFTTTRSVGSFGTMSDEPVGVVMGRWRDLRRELKPGGSRFATARRPAENHRLAGDDLRRRPADLLGVGVHEPRHLALARRHVRCGNVAVRSNDREELRRVAASQALELVRREAVRIAADAALGSTERQTDERALEGHPQ